MNAQSACLGALADLQAGVSQCVEHMNRQDWNVDLAGCVSRHRGISKAAEMLISDFTQALIALGDAGFDAGPKEQPFDTIRDAISKLWSDHFETTFSGMAEDLEIEQSLSGVIELRRYRSAYAGARA